MNLEQPLPDSSNHVNLRCKTKIVFMGKKSKRQKNDGKRYPVSTKTTNRQVCFLVVINWLTIKKSKCTLTNEHQEKLCNMIY